MQPDDIVVKVDLSVMVNKKGCRWDVVLIIVPKLCCKKVILSNGVFYSVVVSTWVQELSKMEGGGGGMKIVLAVVVKQTVGQSVEMTKMYPCCVKSEQVLL